MKVASTSYQPGAYHTAATRRRAASDRKASEDLRIIGDGYQTKEVRA